MRYMYDDRSATSIQLLVAARRVETVVTNSKVTTTKKAGILGGNHSKKSRLSPNKLTFLCPWFRTARGKGATPISNEETTTRAPTLKPLLVGIVGPRTPRLPKLITGILRVNVVILLLWVGPWL